MTFGFSARDDELATKKITNRPITVRNIPIPLFSLSTGITAIRI